MARQIAPARPFGSLVLQQIARAKRDVYAAADQTAGEMRGWMQANHPWQNRTHQAEERLEAGVADLGSTATDLRLAMVARHGVFYGEYLERKGYPVLRPALQVFTPILRRRIQGAIRPESGMGMGATASGYADTRSLYDPQNPSVPHAPNPLSPPRRVRRIT